MEKKTLILLVCLAIAFTAVSCGGQSKQGQDGSGSVYEVMGKEFQVRGCTFNVTKLTKSVDIRAIKKDGTTDSPLWPEQGFFYLLEMEIKPGETPTFQPKFTRYEIVDVDGNRYYETKNEMAIQVAEKNIGVKSLTKIKDDITKPVKCFLLMDCQQNMKGVTLEIISTASDPEQRLAVVDLKE